MTKHVIDYEIDAQTYEGVFFAAESSAPLIVVAHAWAGVGEYEVEKGQAINALGYNAFCMDVYGKGKRGNSVEENQALMMPLVENRAELQKRLAAGLAFAKTQVAETSKAAAVGYCFGGLSVLDMARANMAVEGVVSFHGLFMPADNLSPAKISPKILIEHGWDDPMAQPESVMAITAELTAAGADWQLHAHGGAKHAFTNKAANDPELGTVYNVDADTRSWASMQAFLESCL